MPSLAITHSFVAHTDIVSSQMNQNFQDISTWANNGIAGQTYTPWTAWTPGFTGFSANPTVSYARYMQIGKLLIVTYQDNVNGTSNATTFTITGLPVAAAKTTRCHLFGAYDLSLPLTSAMGEVNTGGVATTLLCYANNGGSAWNNSGNKGAGQWTIMYEVA